MKVVIFAGGLGTRIAEETETRPKPMVDIGGKPILLHIMKMYGHYGYNDFIICLGYKGYLIKEYFMHYYLHNSDITIELGSNKVDVHYTNTESFRVTLVETGLATKTAGRLKHVQQYIGKEDFMLTYGDGVSDINIAELVKFHRKHGKIATVTAIQPEARFGGMDVDKSGIDRPLEQLTEDGQLMAYQHHGFWKCMDAMRDKIELEALWQNNMAKWKTW